MSQHGQHSLGGFEERLLRELRQVVADGPRLRSVPDPPTRSSRHFGRTLPLAIAGVAAAALAIFVASGLLLSGGEPSKAWAVDRNLNGTVTVRIESLSDAAGLERKLNEVGVPALVQYIPPGKTCAGGELQPPPGAVTQQRGDPSAPPTGGVYGLQQGRGTVTVTQTNGQPPAGQSPAGQVPGGAGNAPGGAAAPLTIKHLSDGGIEFTVDANPPSGRTLVIRNQGLAPNQIPGGQASGTPQEGSAPEGSAINVTFVQGKAEPCKLVDSPVQ
jgi:hypothetical protein